MTIGERIKTLRKELKLTQAKFGKNIGVKGSAIGLYESGDRNITDRVITQISQAFHVREEWLRTGEEPRDLPKVSSLLSASHIGDDDRVIVQMYLELPPEKRQVLKEYILNVAKELSRATAPPSDAASAALIDEKVAAYRAKLEAEQKEHDRLHRMLDEELAAEEKAPSASHAGGSSAAEKA